MDSSQQPVEQWREPGDNNLSGSEMESIPLYLDENSVKPLNCEKQSERMSDGDGKEMLLEKGTENQIIVNDGRQDPTDAEKNSSLNYDLQLSGLEKLASAVQLEQAEKKNEIEDEDSIPDYVGSGKEAAKEDGTATILTDGDCDQSSNCEKANNNMSVTVAANDRESSEMFKTADDNGGVGSGVPVVETEVEVTDVVEAPVADLLDVKVPASTSAEMDLSLESEIPLEDSLEGEVPAAETVEDIETSPMEESASESVSKIMDVEPVPLTDSSLTEIADSEKVIQSDIAKDCSGIKVMDETETGCCERVDVKVTDCEQNSRTTNLGKKESGANDELFELKTDIAYIKAASAQDITESDQTVCDAENIDSRSVNDNSEVAGIEISNDKTKKTDEYKGGEAILVDTDTLSANDNINNIDGCCGDDSLEPGKAYRHQSPKMKYVKSVLTDKMLASEILDADNHCKSADPETEKMEGEITTSLCSANMNNTTDGTGEDKRNDESNTLWNKVGDKQIVKTEEKIESGLMDSGDLAVGESNAPCKKVGDEQIGKTEEKIESGLIGNDLDSGDQADRTGEDKRNDESNAPCKKVGDEQIGKTEEEIESGLIGNDMDSGDLAVETEEDKRNDENNAPRKKVGKTEEEIEDGDISSGDLAVDESNALCKKVGEKQIGKTVEKIESGLIDSDMSSGDLAAKTGEDNRNDESSTLWNEVGDKQIVKTEEKIESGLIDSDMGNGDLAVDENSAPCKEVGDKQIEKTEEKIESGSIDSDMGSGDLAAKTGEDNRNDESSTLWNKVGDKQIVKAEEKIESGLIDSDMGNGDLAVDENSAPCKKVGDKQIEKTEEKIESDKGSDDLAAKTGEDKRNDESNTPCKKVEKQIEKTEEEIEDSDMNIGDLAVETEEDKRNDESNVPCKKVGDEQIGKTEEKIGSGLRSRVMDSGDLAHEERFEKGCEVEVSVDLVKKYVDNDEVTFKDDFDVSKSMIKAETVVGNSTEQIYLEKESGKVSFSAQEDNANEKYQENTVDVANPGDNLDDSLVKKVLGEKIESKVEPVHSKKSGITQVSTKKISFFRRSSSRERFDNIFEKFSQAPDGHLTGESKDEEKQSIEDKEVENHSDDSCTKTSQYRSEQEAPDKSVDFDSSTNDNSKDSLGKKISESPLVALENDKEDRKDAIEIADQNKNLNSSLSDLQSTLDRNDSTQRKKGEKKSDIVNDEQAKKTDNEKSDLEASDKSVDSIRIVETRILAYQNLDSASVIDHSQSGSTSSMNGKDLNAEEDSVNGYKNKPVTIKEASGLVHAKYQPQQDGSEAVGIKSVDLGQTSDNTSNIAVPNSRVNQTLILDSENINSDAVDVGRDIEKSKEIPESSYQNDDKPSTPQFNFSRQKTPKTYSKKRKCNLTDQNDLKADDHRAASTSHNHQSKPALINSKLEGNSSGTESDDVRNADRKTGLKSVWRVEEIQMDQDPAKAKPSIISRITKALTTSRDFSLSSSSKNLDKSEPVTIASHIVDKAEEPAEKKSDPGSKQLSGKKLSAAEKMSGTKTGVKALTGSLQCNICGRAFTCSDRYRKHQKSHSAGKQFCCNVCGKMFEHQERLEIHQLVHSSSSKGTFTCQHCGEKCKNWRPFRYHLSKHSVESRKKFACEICGHTLSSRIRLKKHIAHHKKGFNFCCFTCGKLFNCPARFDRHTVAHTSGPRLQTATQELTPKQTSKRPATVSADDDNQPQFKRAFVSEASKATSESAESSDNDSQIEGIPSQQSFSADEETTSGASTPSRNQYSTLSSPFRQLDGNEVRKSARRRSHSRKRCTCCPTSPTSLRFSSEKSGRYSEQEVQKEIENNGCIPSLPAKNNDTKQESSSSCEEQTKIEKVESLLYDMKECSIKLERSDDMSNQKFFPDVSLQTAQSKPLSVDPASTPEKQQTPVSEPVASPVSVNPKKLLTPEKSHSLDKSENLKRSLTDPYEGRKVKIYRTASEKMLPRNLALTSVSKERAQKASKIKQEKITKAEKSLEEKVLKGKDCSPKAFSPESKKSYPCNICGESFRTDSDVKIHIGKHLTRTSPKQTVDIESVAESCRLSCSRGSTDKQGYTCHRCGYSARSYADITKHMWMHSEKKYQCAECCAAFVKLETLQHHMRAHSKTKD